MPSSSNPNQRYITFITNGLNRHITLACVFEKLDVDVLAEDQKSLCWKIIKMRPGGQGRAIVNYSGDTAFFVPQTGDDGQTIDAARSERCNDGQTVRLIKEPSEIGTVPEPTFTKAAKGDPGFMQCVNEFGAIADVGIGLANQGSQFVNPVLLFSKLAPDAVIKCKFIPYLKIYATSALYETQVVEGEIKFPLIWEGNLLNLQPACVFRVTYDGSSGMPEIEVEDVGL